MNCFSDKPGHISFKAGLTLVEIAASMVILAIVCSTVLVVINRSVTAAADDLLRMQAFETARENMEMLLCSKSIKESTEYGYSEKYPAIQWQNSVSTFIEPTTARLWVQAVCSAEYTDSTDEPKKIELTQWTTDLTKDQILELLKLKQEQKQSELDPNQLIATIEDAAVYAGVEPDVIRKWLESGMPVTPDGQFIKSYLDLYKKTGGSPTPEQVVAVPMPYLGGPAGSAKPEQPDGTKPKEQTSPEPQSQKPVMSPFCGVPWDVINRMSFDELWKFLQNCPDAMQSF